MQLQDMSEVHAALVERVPTCTGVPPQHLALAVAFRGLLHLEETTWQFIDGQLRKDCMYYKIRM